MMVSKKQSILFLSLFASAFFGYFLAFTIRETGRLASAPQLDSLENALALQDLKQQESKLDKRMTSVQLTCTKKEDWKYNVRHSSRPYTAPTDIPSVFNCDDFKLCHYFFPNNFFDPNCGLGKEYAYMVTETEERLRQRTLWRTGPRIGMSTITVGVHPAQKDAGERWKTRDHYERLTFVHSHKAGGTSMKVCLGKLSQSGKAKLFQEAWFQPRETLQLGQEEYQAARERLQQAVRYPAEFDDEEEDEQYTLLFTVVRDPVERFISAIGQVMGSSGSKNRLARRFRDACLKETPQSTLRCCIEHIKKRGYWFELHFAPQALDVHFTTMWQDVPVAVFGMSSLPTILKYFGHREVKARNGTDEGYRPDPVLTEMKVDHYDDEMLDAICHLYAVDVLMMQSLGLKTRCPKVV